MRSPTAQATTFAKKVKVKQKSMLFDINYTV